ncbi:hypothetical protein J7I80_05465 [Bacillus sp. ISL-41]|uniref:hypothetical protein n=1 Tax=Bacillus sp. ISL-41 TaxID=2819127 RepID=UPI001BEA1FB5|nr:hypothetical protein [Bacillus sp. ISL-41]MBT2641662.1 hypothetical protein [Bacillus sp. ISL-41]
MLVLFMYKKELAMAGIKGIFIAQKSSERSNTVKAGALHCPKIAQEVKNGKSRSPAK